MKSRMSNTFWKHFVPTRNISRQHTTIVIKFWFRANTFPKRLGEGPEKNTEKIIDKKKKRHSYGLILNTKSESTSCVFCSPCPKGFKFSLQTLKASCFRGGLEMEGKQTNNRSKKWGLQHYNDQLEKAQISIPARHLYHTCGYTVEMDVNCIFYGLYDMVSQRWKNFSKF